MQKKPSYITEAGPDAMPDVMVGDITEATDRIADMQALKKRLRAEGTMLEAKIKKEKQLASDLMAQAGVNSFETQAGHKITAALYMHGKIADGDALYAELRVRGEEGLLKVALSGEAYQAYLTWLEEQGVAAPPSVFSCHSARLDSYLREREEAEEAMPVGVDVTSYDTVIVK